ncbi:MAG: GCN5-related N-acetyltransferase [Sphingobacteriales bacterium]|nr:GCN5-related N-acetyltransferase [Sphingobacteriales bacterium]
MRKLHSNLLDITTSRGDLSVQVKRIITLMMNYSIQKLASTDEYYIDEVCEMLKNTYTPSISQYFIYNDKSFKAFLTSNLTRTDHFIYYISVQKVLIGFAQFKIVANTLYLVNLIVKENYQNNKFGSRLLTYGIIASHTSAPYIKTLELNAFVSNTVLKWYLRLGMKIMNIEYWYDLKEVQLNDAKTSNIELENFKFITDQFGFTQLYLNNLPVGYLINGKKLIIKGNFHFVYLHKIPRVFNGQDIELGCIISDTMINIPLIDRSYLLRIELSDLKFIHDHLSMINN